MFQKKRNDTMSSNLVSKHAVRYALLRNLLLPNDFDVNTCGLYLKAQLPNGTCLRSEISWGSREASWLIGEGALAVLPANISIHLVRRPLPVFHQNRADDGLIENFAAATLAHPFRKEIERIKPNNNNDGQNEDENDICVFTDVLDRLIPLASATTRDLVSARLPPNTLLFSTEHSGRLFANHSTAVRILHGWGRELPVALLSSSVSESSEQEIALLARAFSSANKSEVKTMIDLAERIHVARSKLEQARVTIADIHDRRVALVEASAKKREMKMRQRALEERQAELLEKLRERRSAQEKREVQLLHRLHEQQSHLQLQNRLRQKAAEANIPKLIGNEQSLFRQVNQQLLSRRLVLAAGMLRVYPLAPQLASLGIRDVALDSPNEDEKACALGHMAHLVYLLATIFDVTLRYSPFPFGSRSFIMDDTFFVPMLEPSYNLHQRLEALSNASALASTSGLFPLFSIGVERGAKPKCDTAVTLLLNDIRQVTEALKARTGLAPEKKNSATQVFNNNGDKSKQMSPIVEMVMRFKLVLAELRLTPPVEVRIAH